MTNKILWTDEAAQHLGIRYGQFLRLTRKLGLRKARPTFNYMQWFAADLSRPDVVAEAEKARLRLVTRQITVNIDGEDSWGVLQVWRAQKN